MSNQIERNRNELTEAILEALQQYSDQQRKAALQPELIPDPDIEVFYQDDNKVVIQMTGSPAVSVSLVYL